MMMMMTLTRYHHPTLFGGALRPLPVGVSNAHWQANCSALLMQYHRSALRRGHRVARH